jgi:hypothetical protein
MNRNSFVYFETQQQQHCGLHTLNNILQHPPHFTLESLAQISKEMNKRELLLYSDAQTKTDLVGYPHEISQAIQNDNADADTANFEFPDNVDASGNYTIQTLVEALGSRGFATEFIKTTPANPDVFLGFICYRPGHYFALRNFRNGWCELDSTQCAPVEIYNIKDCIGYYLYSGVLLFGVSGRDDERRVTNRKQRARGFKKRGEEDEDKILEITRYDERRVTKNKQRVQDLEKRGKEDDGENLGFTGYAHDFKQKRKEDEDEDEIRGFAIPLTPYTEEGEMFTSFKHIPLKQNKKWSER